MNYGEIGRGGCLGLLLVGVGSCGLLPPLNDAPSLPLADVSELPPCVADDCNCGDFRDRALAQQVLDALPNDPFRLDRDGNGVACETLPQPVAVTYTAGSGTGEHLALGNPTNAQATNPNNFLLARSQYALSYNGDRGTANWVSWQLNADWLGNTERQDTFRQDGGLPAGVYQVTPNDYRNTGYDRGHIVPSGDRTRSVADNSATFLMTNILPQAPQNNRGIWRELEEYSRDWVYQFDGTLYMLAGGYGVQETLAAGRVTVPSRLWKIIVAIAPGDTIADIDAATPIIAVDMPNRDTAIEDWRMYQTTVDQIELATGYDFLSTVPLEMQATLEATQLDTSSVMPSP